VSIVQIAGAANSQFKTPNPRDAARESTTLNPESWKMLAHSFPGLQQEDLPEGKGWAVERIRLSTHNGTHMDAPYHFFL